MAEDPQERILSSSSTGGVTASLHYLGLMELATRLERRDVSPIEVTQAQLDRIATLDGALGSYALVTAEAALDDATAAEAEITAGRYRGPLHGVPIGIKDLCWTKDIQTAAGMAIYRDFRPKEDATVVARLKQAGAVILGKLQMTEGAYSDHHPSVTPPKNPWNADYWPGISSSGPAVATAAGLCYGASPRTPAALFAGPALPTDLRDSNRAGVASAGSACSSLPPVSIMLARSRGAQRTSAPSSALLQGPTKEIQPRRLIPCPTISALGQICGGCASGSIDDGMVKMLTVLCSWFYQTRSMYSARWVLCSWKSPLQM
jgi:Amidase